MRELRSAQRDEPFTEPVGDQVVAIDAGPADHPRPACRLRCLFVCLECASTQQLFQCAGGQSLVLPGPLAGVELDTFVGKPTAQIHAAVGRVQHSFGRDAAVGIEHPVGIGQLDTAAGEEVRDFVWGRACQFSEIIVSGPRAGFHHPQCGGDELLDIAQVLLRLLTPLVDLAVPARQFGEQLISRRVCLKGLDAGLCDRPAADLGHPADRGGITGMEPDRALVARQAAVVDAQFLGSQLDPAG